MNPGFNMGSWPHAPLGLRPEFVDGFRAEFVDGFRAELWFLGFIEPAF